MADSDFNLLLQEARRLSQAAQALASKPERNARAQANTNRIPSTTPAVGDVREAQQLLLGGRVRSPSRPRGEEDFQAVLRDIQQGPFGGEYNANLGTVYEFLLRPPGETFDPLTRRSHPSETIAAQFPGRPEGSLANLGTEFVLGAIEPGPADFAAAIGNLAMLAPKGVMRMLRSAPNIEFVDPNILVRGRGNPLQGEEYLQELQETIMRNPEGLMDPVIVQANPARGEWFVGEGNHRIEIARRLGIPVPVRVVNSGTINSGAVKMDVLGQSRLGRLRGNLPHDLTPSDIGLSVIPERDIRRAVGRRVASGEIQTTNEELLEFSEFMRNREVDHAIQRNRTR